jgi:thiamine pyrophosphate-dependent acetolactate synthase large subunit-like protein
VRERRCVDPHEHPGLATAIQHNAPVKVVLVNNGCMGMVRQWQQLNYA